jgi:predicted dehydrogenase
VCDLLLRWPDGPWTPNLDDGLRAQAICEAMERSAETKRWVTLDEIERDG